MICLEIRCRDCDRLISTCPCQGDKLVVYHQCRLCESADLAEQAAADRARAATLASAPAREGRP